MNDRNLWARVLFNISRFISFFLVVSLVITIAMMVFLKDMELDEALIRQNAPTAFLAAVVMTLIGCVVDAFRRHQAIDKPLKRIVDALSRITKGDFSVQLDLRRNELSGTGFEDISLAINALAKELSGVETLRTDFIANVSHELKTPLAVMQNYATILQDPSLPPERRKEYAQTIAHTTRRLADLVSNILKLNKLENQQIYPDTSVFDLGEQLAECLLSFESAWENKDLEIECSMEDEVLVEADPELLRLVWNNLFSNAIKFTPNGGKITLTLAREGSWAVVSVADTGCGMTKETGAHIFEKFYQGDTVHATQGNGLGLALVKRVVDITGGVINVVSTPGKGSTFTVRLGRVDHGAG